MKRPIHSLLAAAALLAIALFSSLARSADPIGPPAPFGFGGPQIPPQVYFESIGEPTLRGLREFKYSGPKIPTEISKSLKGFAPASRPEFCEDIELLVQAYLDTQKAGGPSASSTDDSEMNQFEANLKAGEAAAKQARLINETPWLKSPKQLFRVMRGTAKTQAADPRDRFNTVLLECVLRPYAENPEWRDPLVQYLKFLSHNMTEELRALDRMPEGAAEQTQQITLDALEGASWAYTLFWGVRTLRNAPESTIRARGLYQRTKNWLSGISKARPVDANPVTHVAEQTAHTLKNIEGAAIKPGLLRRLGDMAKTEGRWWAYGLATGGVYNIASGLEERALAVKLDPIATLFLVQSWIVIDLEIEIMRTRVELMTGPLRHFFHQTPDGRMLLQNQDFIDRVEWDEKLRQELSRIAREFEEVQKQVSHLAVAVPGLRGQHPIPESLRKVLEPKLPEPMQKALGSKPEYRREAPNRVERTFGAELERSPELRLLLSEMGAEIGDVLARHGSPELFMKYVGEGKVNLSSVQTETARIRTLFGILNEAQKPAEEEVEETPAVNPVTPPVPIQGESMTPAALPFGR